MHGSSGTRFRYALKLESPLQIAGTINAYSAILAEQAGFQAIYLSGAGVANASFGIPDIGITNLNDVCDDVMRIRSVCDLPLLVDIDTGWGNWFGIQRTIKTLEAQGVAAVHIEDQVSAKRCGHRPNKEVVPKEEMCDRLKAALDARVDADFVIMARTDALQQEGLSRTVDRIHAYREAGADAIFLEGARDLSEYEHVVATCGLPVLANITEFGLTPLFSIDELAKTGVAMALYPLSAFRAMNRAAELTYQTIRQQGTQSPCVAAMQTREELYQTLNYLEYETKL
jgi:methylisocitrate lyase